MLDDASGGTADDTRSPRLTPKGRDTRQRLLDAGRMLFARHGYAGVRISDITAEAGLSQGAFYRYFPDRRELMLELLRELTSEAFDFVRFPWDAASPVKSVLESTKRYFEFFERNRALFGVLIELAQSDADVAEIGHRARERFYSRVANALRRGIDAGVLRPDLDVQVAAELLGSMSEFYAFQRFVLPSSAVTEVPMESAAETLAAIWIRGIRL